VKKLTAELILSMFTEKEIVNYEISKVFDTAKYLKLVIEFLNVAALVF